jgi:hypothetical protein
MGTQLHPKTVVKKEWWRMKLRTQWSGFYGEKEVNFS